MCLFHHSVKIWDKELGACPRAMKLCNKRAFRITKFTLPSNHDLIQLANWVTLWDHSTANRTGHSDEDPLGTKCRQTADLVFLPFADLCLAAHTAGEIVCFAENFRSLLCFVLFATPENLSPTPTFFGLLVELILVKIYLKFWFSNITALHLVQVVQLGLQEHAPST